MVLCLNTSLTKFRKNCGFLFVCFCFCMQCRILWENQVCLTSLGIQVQEVTLRCGRVDPVCPACVSKIPIFFDLMNDLADYYTTCFKHQLFLKQTCRHPKASWFIGSSQNSALLDPYIHVVQQASHVTYSPKFVWLRKV